MKKFIQFSCFIIIAIVSLSLSSCKNDDNEPLAGDSNNSKLIGIWYVEQTTYEYYTTNPDLADYYNRTEIEPGDGSYWEFSSSQVTVHDPNDLANNYPVNYKYNSTKKELSIIGLTYTVKKLTSSTMVLYYDTKDSNFGQRVTIEFSK